MNVKFVFFACLVLIAPVQAGLVYVTNQVPGQGTAVFNPDRWTLEEPLPVETRLNPLVIGAGYGWALSPDGRALIKVRLNDGRTLSEVPLPLTATALGAAGPEGLLVWSARENTMLRFVDPKTMLPLPQTLNLPGVAELFFPRPGSATASCAALLVSPPAVALVNFADLKVEILPLPEPAWDLAFSPDGRYLAASHPSQDEITIRDLQGKKLFKRITLPGHPRGLAFQGAQALWVSRLEDDTGVLSRVDLEGDCVTASFRLVGLPSGLACLPADKDHPCRLLVAAYVPELERGMLYAFDPATHKVLDSQPVSGKPWRLIAAPSTADPEASGPAPVSTAAEAKSSTVDAVVLPSKKTGLFRGDFEGVIWNKADGQPISQASVFAVNRKGRRYEGKVDSQGRYRVEDLPWGTYTLEAEAPGFQKISQGEQTLALTGTVVFNFKMDPLLVPKLPDTPEP